MKRLGIHTEKRNEHGSQNQESGHGGYVVEKGIRNDPDFVDVNRPGYRRQEFVVFASARYDTLAEAKKAAKQMA